jgi:hypothetical protein
LAWLQSVVPATCNNRVTVPWVSGARLFWCKH